MRLVLKDKKTAPMLNEKNEMPTAKGPGGNISVILLPGDSCFSRYVDLMLMARTET